MMKIISEKKGIFSHFIHTTLQHWLQGLWSLIAGHAMCQATYVRVLSTQT